MEGGRNMNGIALLGLVLVLYGGAVIALTLKKPEKIWEMGKIKLFRKVLGEKGTDIFFMLFALVAMGVGLWLLVK